MFDAVLARSNTPKQRLGLGSVVSLGAHLAVVGALVFLSLRPAKANDERPQVVFKQLVQKRGAAPAVQKSSASDVKAERKTSVVSTRRTASPRVPEQTSIIRTSNESMPSDSATPGLVGSMGDDTGQTESGATGSGDTVIGGESGQGGTDIVAFGDGMTKPRCAWNIEYTREAREAQIEGLALLKCNIMADGSVQGCRIVKGLEHMSEAILSAATRTRCSPATFQGKAISVNASQSIQLSMPK